jgi:hypothetical protein
VLVFDAAGLALFAVSGAGKALAFHAGPVAATLLGMLTGIGGGMVRDVLVREIPTVLRTELYASRGPDRRCCGGNWKHAASLVLWGGSSRRSPLLWAPIYGDAVRVAASNRTQSELQRADALLTKLGFTCGGVPSGVPITSTYVLTGRYIQRTLSSLSSSGLKRRWLLVSKTQTESPKIKGVLAPRTNQLSLA